MKKILLAFVICILVSSALWAQSGEYGSKDSEKKVLIAYESTRFKKKFIEPLIEKLENEGTYIVAVDHQKGELDGLKASDFSVVFITNSGVKAQVREEVVKWLQANGGNPENVIVHTTQTTEWKPGVQVDSITSASLRKKDEIADFVDKILSDIMKKW